MILTFVFSIFYFFCHNISIHWRKIYSFGTFKVIIGNCHLKIVKIFLCKDLKSRLVSFVRDTIPYSCTEHELGGTHKIIHYIFQRWHQGIFVYQIKIDFFISNNLDSYVFSNKVNLSSHILYFVVLLPKIWFIVNFKEQDWTRRTSDECSVK